MLKTLPILIFLFIAKVAFSQNDLQEVVYLKNGSIIRGTIIEHVMDKSISIQTADGSVFVYTMDQVEKITKELRLKQPSSQTVKESSSGYTGSIKFGDILGLGDYSGSSFWSINLFNGAKISEQGAIGIGLGVEGLGNGFLIPIYFSGRTTFGNGMAAPFIYGNFGYTVATSSSFSVFVGVGITAGFGFGVKIYTSPAHDFGITLDAGYRRQTGGGNFADFSALALNFGLSY